MARRAVLTGAVLLLVIAGGIPVLVMLVKSLTPGGRFTLDAYQSLLETARLWRLVRNSLSLALLTAAVAGAAGMALAILFARTDLPFRRTLVFLFSIPLLIPSYITAAAWFAVLGREGLVARLFGPAAGAVTSGWLFGLGGCVLVLAITFLPLVMLLAMTYLRAADPRLEEAGRLVAGWPAVLRRITLPLMRPAIVFAVMLVFLLALGEFGVPSFLRYDVFPVESFTQFSAFYNFAAAMAAAVPLALVTLLLLLAEEAFGGVGTLQLRPAAGSPGAIPLGSARSGIMAAVGGSCFVFVVLPFAALFLDSFQLAAYREAIQRAGDSLTRSLFYAAGGATVLTILGFFLGYLTQRRALWFWRATDFLALFLFALPGSVIGIGLISLWNRPATNFIYSTPAIILLGYVAQYSALSSRIAAAALAQVPASMEEAAQVSGAGWLRRIGWVVAPLAARGLLAAWLVGYIFCLRDTVISMVVYPPGRDPLPVRIFTLMANGAPPLIAALCVIMILATLLPVVVLAAVVWRRPRTA